MNSSTPISVPAIAVAPTVVTPDVLDPSCWMQDFEKVKALKDLKTLSTSNCRLLYGSDRNRFFDIVVSYNTSNGYYGAYLVLTIDTTTKALRKAIADCPIKATQIIADGLQKDTALLMTKHDVGDRFSGQQGCRDHRGEFELYEEKEGRKKDAADAEDDTSNMGSGRGGGYGGYGGRGGYSGRGGGVYGDNKRRRD